MIEVDIIEVEESEEHSDFACIECGEEFGSDDCCVNGQCPLYGAHDDPPSWGSSAVPEYVDPEEEAGL